jgi:hypothetical protein
MHNSFKVLPLVDNTLSSLCLVYKLISESFFGLKDDIYTCFIYNPPEYSSYSRKLQDDILELIEKDISKYSNDGKIILACG